MSDAQDGLPAAVIATRTTILEAARVCDLAELARIANEDPDNPFRYSIPDRGDPLQHWTGSKFDPTILSVHFSLPATLHTFEDTQNGQVSEEFYVLAQRRWTVTERR